MITHETPGDDDLLWRMFEPMTPNWERIFHEGDTVELTRPITLGIPVGARGTITQIERPVDESEASPDYFKGRVLTVKFDLTPYKIPYPPEWRKTITVLVESGAISADEVPEYLTEVTTAVTPMDVRKVERQ